MGIGFCGGIDITGPDQRQQGEWQKCRRIDRNGLCQPPERHPGGQTGSGPARRAEHNQVVIQRENLIGNYRKHQYAQQGAGKES